MRCIYCSADSKFKDRQANGGRCTACQHPFAFEPKTNPLTLTDARFQRAIKDVSGDGALFFTERQLYYEFNRRIARRALWRAPWGWVAAGSGAAAMTAVGIFSIPWLLPVAVVGIIGSGIRSHRAGKNTPLPIRLEFDVFCDSYLSLWQGVHGKIEKLVPTPPAAAPHPPSPVAEEVAPSPVPTPPDLTAYSFDRALVTNKAETAAMLVANNFHFENNCAILSISGYPRGIFDTVMTMLQKNPNLTVFAVHDASVPGCDLPRRLREAGWFPDTAIRIVELGLRPRDAVRLRLPVLVGMATPVPFHLRQSLGPEDAEWLASGRAAELAALRPAKLMRAIYQGFARANQLDGTTVDGGGGFFIWGHDPGAGVYASDSFG